VSHESHPHSQPEYENPEDKLMMTKSAFHYLDNLLLKTDLFQFFPAKNAGEFSPVIGSGSMR